MLTCLQTGSFLFLTYLCLRLSGLYSGARPVFIAGFPAGSPDFAVLKGQALGEMQERDRAHYLAYLDAQAAFERMKNQIEGDGVEPTATGATIAEKNGGSE
jgi:hypothetical protein